MKKPLPGFKSLRTVLLSSLALMQLASAADRPNIVVIVSDDQSHRHFGFTGGKVITPNLDRLAENGVVFQGFRSVSTVCSPSRFNFLSGRFASRQSWPGENGHGYFMFGMDLKPHDRSIITELNDHGYFTGVIGKADGYVVGPPRSKELNEIKDLDPTNPEHDAVLKRNQAAINEKIKQTTHADYVGGIFPGNPPSWPKGLVHHNQDWITATAFDFFDEAEARGEPFFLWMPPTIIHTGDKTRPNNFADELVQRTTPAGLLDAPLDVQPSRQSVLDRSEAAGVKDYMVTWLDDSVGAVVDRLHEKGMLENTIIIYGSDHSGFGGKGTLYEMGTNVPMILYWKGKTEQLPDNEQVVGSVDLVPTLLELAGVDDGDYPSDGRSLVAALRPGQELEDAPLYLEQGHMRAVITGDGNYKYIAFRMPWDALKELPANYKQKYINTNDVERPDDTHLGEDMDEEFETMMRDSRSRHPSYYEADQLYDLQKDPEEQVNLAYNPEYAEVVSKLKLLLAQKLQPLPGTFGEFKYETRVDNNGVDRPAKIEGDVDLSGDYNVITLAANSHPKEDSYTLIEYTGQLIGTFEDVSSVESHGYRVDYSQPGKILIVKK